MKVKEFNAVLAGFGGQGVLFFGKVIATAGLVEGKEVSWMPSYGPEMRGGTANCSVCLSDSPIGSPLVSNPTVLAALNLPSYDKFIDLVEPGGIVLVDSSLISKKTDRDDISEFYIPATRLADENDLKGGANMILLGKLFKETEFCAYESLKKAIEQIVPSSKPQLLSNNFKAISIGMEYEAD